MGRLAVAVLMVLALTGGAEAHNIPIGVGTRSICVFHEGRLALEFNVGYSSITGIDAMQRMDEDVDFVVSDAEADKFIAALSARVLPDITVLVDGRPLALRETGHRASGLVGTIQKVQFDVFFDLEATLPADLAPGTSHTLYMRDGTFMKDVSQQLIHVPFKEHDLPGLSFNIEQPEFQQTADSFMIMGREVEVSFSWTPMGGAAVPAASATPRPVREVRQTTEEDRESGQIIGYMTRDLTGWGFVMALIVCAALGALHGLGPGHGKAMVGSYLIGTRGRIRDAVVLGIVVTITHTSTNFILGIAMLLASERYGVEKSMFQKHAILWGGFLSGAFVMILGLALAVKRLAAFLAWRQAAAHGHDHGHDHDHGHTHAPPAFAKPPDQVTAWDLLSLGISGGMLPCPTGFVVVLVAMATGKIGLGLILLTAFSLGLGLLVIALGVLLVTGRSTLLARLGEGGPLVRAIPIASAALVSLVGAYVAVESLVKGGVVKIALGP